MIQEGTSLKFVLPEVRGRYRFATLLSKQTWFQVGGPADVVFRPEDIEDLQYFLKNIDDSVPVTVLGAGSNVLVRDSGIQGVVVRLGAEFTKITTDEIYVTAGAGALDRTVALVCRDVGIGGLEFFVGIPGTIGGALKMNAGAYGREVKDILLWAEAVDRKGILHRIGPDEMKMSYRHCGVPEDWIFVRGCFQGVQEEGELISSRLDAILKQREETQPTRGRTGGSTFKNPENNSAWKLIDEVGCRGYRVGDAQVSEKHCNFLINNGNATAEELEQVGEDVRAKVKDKTGIDLEWEIKRLGRIF